MYDIMATILFTDNQKAAIISLLIEMINIDREIDPRECEVFNAICVEHAVSEDTYKLGRALDSMAALEFMKRMSDFQKIYTAQLLIRVIDADEKDDDNEIRLFNLICSATGVDVLINAWDKE